MVTKFNAIIVGGGLGGLTAGAILSKFGRKVLLLEQHYIPGGCATSFKRKDFVMEVGLHEMDGLFEKDAKVQIFDLLEVNKFIEFKQVPEFFNVKWNETEFTFPHGYERTQELLIEKFPSETKGIKSFFKLMKGVLEETPKIPTEKWKSMLLFPIMPLLFPNVVKASRFSVGHWLDKNIQNEGLKLILTTNVLYYGDDPYTLSLLYFSLGQSSYIGGGGHFIKGGSQQLSNYLAQYIQKHGGQVLLGKKVEQIIVENGKTSGVKFKDAFNESSESITIDTDAVVVNAAIPLAVKMLPDPYKTSLSNKIKNMEEACSLISIYMGFDIDLKEFGVKHYSTFIQGEGIHSLKDLKPNYQGDWNNKSFVFVDYSQVDSALAPAGKSVGVICAADYLKDWEDLNPIEYKVKKEQVAQLFFERLEKQYPGIINHLEYYEVGTSKTIQKYTLNPKGTAYGYAQTPAQSGMGRISSKSPVKNMYFASAWSFPGGGFSGAIIGGFLSAFAMNKKMKWQRQDTEFLKDSRIVKLLKKQVVAENTVELIFEKPPGFKQEAGQYAILKLNTPKYNNLDMPFRSLSIVSHASEPVLRFAMRKSDSSFKKSCMEMTEGEEATIFGPTGKFVLNKDIQNIVFLISGIGITPIIPMLKELEKIQFTGQVFLFYSNKTKSSTAYDDELKNISLKNYTYQSVITSETKRIDAELLKSHLKAFEIFEYYIVGTSPFLKTMKQILINEGVDLLRIKEDDFG
jgi:phytoene dehydrogenase-like protein/ferredoxin-NADP reductase